MTTAGQPDRFRILSDLFDELVELGSGERDAVIEERCGDDRALATELHAMLAADDAADPDGFLAGLVAAEATAMGEADVVGRRLGPWRVVRPLAQGGMGTVYVGERADGAYEARAAIKIVRGGLSSPALDARFRVERQILAGLSHPGVAKLLDGGTTPDGTPFLVMEFIEGRSITAWCQARAPTVEERLRIFLKVCDAVAYAHGQLVAHRDLKPSNILVGDDGEPKLLDFGIAKLVDAIDESAGGAGHTMRLMTPAYAGPEQIAGGEAGVATDVYALGVLLYEMLTGRLPIETAGISPAVLMRKVAEEVPPLASSVVEGPELARKLRGDLDAVLSRALRKAPGERYPSVELLAEDVRRHLTGLPVQVRRDDWLYRTGKALRRNAGAVVGAALVVVLLVSFSISSFIQARRLATERDRAEAERATAERVSAFLEELLGEADPNVASGRQVTAREVLDRGAERILTGLGEDALIGAALATVMGRVYLNLGEYDAARPLLDSALAVRRRIPAVGAERLVAESLVERGALAYDTGEWEAALALQTEALELYERTSTGDDDRVADVLDWIATSLMELGRLDESEAHTRRALAMYRRLHAPPHEAIATTQISLADMLRNVGRYDEALPLIQDALEQRRSLFGDTHLQVAQALNHLASTYHRSGRSAEAVPRVQEALAIFRAVFPEPHPETGAALGNLANILSGLGRYDEAERARRESLTVLRAAYGGDHPYVAATTFSLGQVLFDGGRLQESEQVLLEALRLHRATLPEGHPNLGFPLTTLGRLFLRTDRPEEAERVLREAYETRQSGLPDGHWEVAASALELGRALDALGRELEAEDLLRESHETLLAAFGPGERRVGQATEALRAHYLRRGMPDRAAALDSIAS